LAIREPALAADSPYIGESLEQIGAALGKLRRYDEAQKMLQRSLGIIEHSLGANSPKAVDVLAEIAKIHLARGNLPKAISYASRASTMFTKALGPSNAVVSIPLIVEVKARLASGAPVRAIPLLERALRIREKAAVSPQEKADVAFTLARALVRAGRDRWRALELARRGRELYREQGKGYEENVSEIDRWLARADRAAPVHARSR